MTHIRRFIIIGLLILLPILGGAYASSPGDETVITLGDNPMPQRDPVDLAVRLGGLDPAIINIAPRPAYQVGDRERFNLGGGVGSQLRNEELLLAAATDSLYMWFEPSVGFDPAAAQDIAQTLSTRVLPRLRELFGTERDIEGDPHIYVLNVTNAGSGIAGVFLDTDRYPNEVLSSSNEINSLTMAISTQSGPYYLSVFAHEFQHLIQADMDESEETWFAEGIAELGSFLALPEYFDNSRQIDYVVNYTGNQLNGWPQNPQESPLPYYGGASLFLTYITQRYGEGWVRYVATEPADGILGVERALAAFGAVDPQTGEVVDVNDIFADFVIANWVNDPTVGDGRFAHTLTAVTAKARPSLTISAFPFTLPDASVKQYGTRYIVLESPSAQTVRLTFQGRETVNVLPTQPHSGQYFYWSQNGNQANSRLTGRFDLSGVSSATLKFWTWYDIEALWDYGYISLSTDSGATWQVLTTPSMTSQDPYDRAFAVGLTGLSGSGTRPAPYIGFAFSDSLLVEEVNPGTPAEAAGLQVGDVVGAINGQWVTPDNFFEVLDQYQPGQAITLSVNRGGEMLELPVTLAAHPSRTLQGDAAWIQESIDLTPYVGGEVLIRFDYVTDQATSLPGWVLDDLEIPEIGFYDSAESANAAWNSEGWARINNLLSQDYLVQLVQYGNGISVTRLLEPDGGHSGEWTIALLPSQKTVLAISGIAPVTTEPAKFDLQIN